VPTANQQRSSRNNDSGSAPADTPLTWATGLPSSKRTRPASALLAADFTSFKQQESIFVVLNLFVLAILLLIHTLGSSRWGRPSLALIVVLSGAFTAQVGELVWLQGRNKPLSPSRITLLTVLSIVMNISLAFLLAELSNRQDIQYYIVLVVPILEAAFRLPLIPTITVVGIADFITFFWVWEYERQHLVLRPGEYIESGTVSLIFTIVGILVWLLVNHLKQTEVKLAESLTQLERARVRLLNEEKLAAVGRLSSAIAHEIRNPVAIISSALSTVNREGVQASVREEMCDIAAKEASRLEKLTTDFLTYARPRGPNKLPTSVADTLGYVAEVCRARSNEKDVILSVRESGDLMADMDAAQVQQALINLVMNAVEASPPSGRVLLGAVADGSGQIQIDVEDAAGPIPPEVTAQIFEPFFTTKPGGTGLGLAIARNIARAHGGDLVLSTNRQECVRFSLTLTRAAPPASRLS
jgi:signal transduction histidine kinase